LLDALFSFFFAKRAFSSTISVTMDWANVFHDALQIFDVSNIENWMTPCNVFLNFLLQVGIFP
jgi:hypothetical protein